MKTFNYYYENLMPPDSLLCYCAKDDILYFDIETTGLSKVKNHIYLIGCGYYSESGLNVIQWFAENEFEESEVLKSFINFSSSFNTLVNYNGKTFDIPFTSSRLEKYNMTMNELDSFDLYVLVKPLKKFLSLNDLTQKSVESFLKIKREDKFNGGELISVYNNYANVSYSQSSYYHSRKDDFKSNNERLDALLLHNKEDVLNMHYLSGITAYNDLLNSSYNFETFTINEYCDYSGCRKKELLLTAKYNNNSNIMSFNSFYSNEAGAFFMNYNHDGTVSLRIPILSDTLKCYLNNYKDYYYLPKEDICILKSMGGGVSKENRENAKKGTCYVKNSGLYIPVKYNKSSFDAIYSCDESPVHIFKHDYKSKIEYILLSDFENLPEDIKSEYIIYIINSFV